MTLFPHWLLAFALFFAPMAFAEDDHRDHDHDHDDHGHEDEVDVVAELTHDHDAHGDLIMIDPDIAAQMGLTVHSAQGGTVERNVSFPAEVVVNRERVASVTPTYAGRVIALYREIGDRVEPGDLLASLESRETLARYDVVSPRAGMVTAKDASTGEAVGEDTRLFDIADLSDVWVDIQIYPTYLHAIQKGLPVTSIAADGHQMATTLHYISPMMSRETRTVLARAILVEPTVDFRPGAFVQAIIPVNTQAARVRVEATAVQRIDGETIVFVDTGHGFEPREVTAGLAGMDHVEILHGLSPGERYVAEGAFALKAHLVTQGIDPHAGHGH